MSKSSDRKLFSPSLTKFVRKSGPLSHRDIIGNLITKPPSRYLKQRIWASNKGYRVRWKSLVKFFRWTKNHRLRMFSLQYSVLGLCFPLLKGLLPYKDRCNLSLRKFGRMRYVLAQFVRPLAVAKIKPFLVALREHGMHKSLAHVIRNSSYFFNVFRSLSSETRRGLIP
jgi:hypothetical protein